MKENETDKNASVIERFLDAGYDFAINSRLGGLQKSAPELASSYKRSGKPIDKCVDSLIRWQCTKTGVSGFVTGLPGILALPVVLPADLTSLWFVQLRMVAAISVMYDLDPKDDHVRTLCYATLLGSGAEEAISKVGAEIAKKSATVALKRMPSSALVSINRAIGYRLLTKFGQKGIINLNRAIPVVGGIVGATFNTAGTLIVGKTAKRILMPDGFDPKALA